MERTWDCECGTCGKEMNNECGGLCDRREGREFYETCNACAEAEEHGFIGASCSVCRTWTVCRAPLPQTVYCGVCDPNPPPPPAPLTENQRTDIVRMLVQLDPQLAAAAGLGGGGAEPDSDSDSEWNSENCEDDRHDVDEYCPACGHRSECARCGDDAVGNYGEHLDALCADCRDDEGFCFCGDLRAECGHADE